MTFEDFERKHCRCDAMRGVTCSIHDDLATLRREHGPNGEADTRDAKRWRAFIWTCCKDNCSPHYNYHEDPALVAMYEVMDANTPAKAAVAADRIVAAVEADIAA